MVYKENEFNDFLKTIPPMNRYTLNTKWSLERYLLTLGRKNIFVTATDY
ncbi:MAG: hypothetical protein ABIC04_01985 [Nanoarchaeota archaeon]